MTVPVIFQFYVLRGRRTKGLRRRPFVNTGLLRHTLGLAHAGSNKQRYSRGRPFGRDKVYPKLLKSYVSSSLIWRIPHFTGHTDILCRLAPDLNLQDSENMILAHRCMSEPAWASPNVRFVGEVIHKRGSPWNPSCAPAA